MAPKETCQLPPCGSQRQPLSVVDDDLRSDKQTAFVREYPKDWNGTQAAIRAGYSEATANEQASRLLAKANIRAAIDRRISEMDAVAEVNVALVLRDLLDVATADPRELVAVHRDCCRYCWGIDHLVQWTPGEYRRTLDAALSAEEPRPAPDFAGGLDFNPTREPHPDCPECFGRGVESVVITDTRKLSGKAAKLYAGAQQTKEGIKVLMANQGEARQGLGRYLGMFTDKTQVSGPGGGPIALVGMRAQDLTDDQLAALASAGSTPLALAAPAAIEGSLSALDLPHSATSTVGI